MTSKAGKAGKANDLEKHSDARILPLHSLPRRKRTAVILSSWPWHLRTFAPSPSTSILRGCRAPLLPEFGSPDASVRTLLLATRSSALPAACITKVRRYRSTMYHYMFILRRSGLQCLSDRPQIWLAQMRRRPRQHYQHRRRLRHVLWSARERFGRRELMAVVSEQGARS
jgi:hypothetical protein